MRYKRISIILISVILLTILICLNTIYAQKPYRVGTTSADFLEMGIGSDGKAMGDAYVSIEGSLSSIYWNPAGLAFINKNEAMFMYQPWFVDINLSSGAVVVVLPPYGNLAFGFSYLGYGEMEVTTLEMQEGTGEIFNANEYCFSFSFSRKLAQWFSFGVSGKYISSQIWHTRASSAALDLGVLVKTDFFSPTGNRENGMRIGMSISNYGTRMRYDGMDLLQPIDIKPNEAGNYSNVKGQFRLNEWELPLIFRLGFSIQPIVLNNHILTIAADALHPNNNCESVNIGGQYELKLPGSGSLFLRIGYKSLFMEDSEFGLTFGGGVVIRFMNNYTIKVDYAFNEVGLLGNTQSYTVSLSF